ncbi:MAG: hypothetical protein JW889_16155 [Verrucomicrobia bacterium]|nr:hypothetical protein [Verrucomicrobiota bacterium]
MSVVLGIVCVAAMVLTGSLMRDAASSEPGDSGEAPSAKVTAQRGATEALLLDTEEWAKTSVGRTYVSGTELKTGERSYIEVALDENNSFRIKGTTQVRVDKILAGAEDEDGTIIRLVQLEVLDGEVNARLGRLPDDVRVRVASPTCVAGASGTGFTVSFDKLKQLSLVNVVESSVVVEALDRADKKVKVEAFQQVEATPWQGGRITAAGRGIPNEDLLGKAVIDKLRQEAAAITITAAAIGQPPQDENDNAKRRALAQEEADNGARAKLTQIVLGLAVDEQTTVADLAGKDEALAGKLYGLIAGLEAGEPAFGDDDSCTVTLAVKLGAISDVVGQALPATFASVGEIAKADYLDAFGPAALITTKRAATVDAQRRIAEKIYGSVVEGGRVLNDVATGPVRVTVRGVVLGAEVVEEHYYSDGSVTIVLSAPGDQIAAQHGDLVGDTFLSSPEPAVLRDFTDYTGLQE